MADTPECECLGGREHDWRLQFKHVDYIAKTATAIWRCDRCDAREDRREPMPGYSKS
jgi:hypothetical protein